MCLFAGGGGSPICPVVFRYRETRYNNVATFCLPLKPAGFSGGHLWSSRRIRDALVCNNYPVIKSLGRDESTVDYSRWKHEMRHYPAQAQ